MNTSPEEMSTTFSRRQLLSTGGAGIGALALGGAGFGMAPHTAGAVQIAATPPAASLPIGEATDPVADLAARLGYDLQTIFAFVRDEINYESYAGVLRGAKGTLWARAGNSADQAVLLGALLEASQFPYRFAFGELPPDSVERLNERIAPTIDSVRATFDAALLGVDADPTTLDIAASAALSIDQQEVVDLVKQQVEEIQTRAATLIDATVTSINDALARAGIKLPPLAQPMIPELERSRHAWIQVSDGPQWIDLDPTFTGTRQESTLATATSTANDMPDDLLHVVRIRLVVEEVFGGYPSRRDALTYESASHRLANTPIALAMTGPSDMRNVGVTISDLFSGAVTFAPCLIAGDDAVTVTTPVVFGAGAGSGVIGALDDSSGDGPADGETIGVWFIAEVSGPGMTPLTVERTLLDRVGIATRSTGTIDLSAVAPLELVTGLNGKQTVPGLDGLTIITTEVARMPSLHALRDGLNAELFGQLHLFGPSFAAFRNSLVFEHGVAAGFDVYPTGPNLSAFTVSLVNPASAQSGMEVTVDLLVQHPSLVAVKDASPARGDISPFVVAGVLNQVAEQVLIEPMVATTDGTDVNLVRPTVGSVYQEAETAGIDIVALTSGADLAGLVHSNDARARIQGALDLGLVVVVPRAAVTIGEATLSGWWLIDPLTGRTWDQMEDGRGFAGAQIPRLYDLIGFGKLLNNVRTWAAPYTALGRCMAVVIAAAVNASDYTSTGNLVNSAIETFKNVNPADAKGCV